MPVASGSDTIVVVEDDPSIAELLELYLGFLTEIFERPATERPYILFPVGYPAETCEVPDLERKPLDEALHFAP